MHKLNTRDKQFAKQFEAFLTIRESGEEDVARVVKDILARVKAEGDAAVIALTQQFDRITLTPGSMRIGAAEIATARKACSKDVMEALALAAKRIRSYHQKQYPKNLRYKDSSGVTLGWRWNAVDAVGLYVPGGRASYPSSVLMNAIPALVAGVKRIVMVVPTPDGIVNPAILAAASMAGVSEIYRIGGAQAVGALAYGTVTVAQVDKIVGPGNAYVAEAKRQVFGKVGIDMIAGPSEIVVVADKHNNPGWIAADLLSQAEHDPLAQAVLISDDADFAARVEKEVKATLTLLPTQSPAARSWEKYGAVIRVKTLNEAAMLVDKLAPEHTELAVEKPEALASLIRHSGALFLGRHTPEAIGDYIAGPSHVLPTSRTARFSSGLSVFDFLKRTSIIGCSAAAAKKIGKDAALLADTEGLDAHALSIRMRL